MIVRLAAHRGSLAVRFYKALPVLVGRSLEQHIYKLRRKLALSEARCAQMKTVYLPGYKLESAGDPLATASAVHAGAQASL